MKDVRPRTQGPEPSAACLAPRAFSVGVVVLLGEGLRGRCSIERTWVNFNNAHSI